jgi:hypothetical protein
VREVTRSGVSGTLVTVRGHRRIIAYTGAVLVRWDAVPADLSVWQPSLEDALLGLLGADQGSATETVNDELVGGRR